MNGKSLGTLLVGITIFAIAMGFLESSVVVYLRELYYPGTDIFPLVKIDQHIAITELLREAATILMLIGIGWLAGRNLSERFAWFLYSFAIWDIFYYVFLKLLIAWPDSLMTWDILFLIPVTWVGPVITPVLLALLMIALALLILTFNRKHATVRLGKAVWSLLILGAVVCIVAFCYDYCQFIIREQPDLSIFSVPLKADLWELTYQYTPQQFPWWIYWPGVAIITSGIGLFWRQQQVRVPD